MERQGALPRLIFPTTGKLSWTIFDANSMSILLLAGLLASIATLITIVVFCLRGEFRRASQTAVRWGICAAAYAAILVVAAMTSHESALKTGASYCDDDMCMSVESVNRTPGQAGSSYRFAIRLFTRANHGPRSAKGASVYLTDERNRRFLPVYDPPGTPFDVDVEPGQAINTSLTFHVPSDARTLAFAAAMDHLQYASFVIGNGDLLHNPRLKLRIQ